MGYADILINTFTADNAESGDDLMGISRQHLKHFCGVFPVCRLAEHFSVYGNDRIASDYNSQKSEVLYTAIGSMRDSSDELMVKIQDVLELEEVRDRLETYTASKMNEESFNYTKPNLLKSWGVLALFSGIYALIGLLFLELIDRDKR